MLWKGQGFIEMEKGEPVLRSCWECNPAHEYLKKVNWLHYCLGCGRYWVFENFLDFFQSDEEFDGFFKERGMAPGDSTTQIDAGYRVMVLGGPPGEN